MTYATQNQIRSAFQRETEAVARRSRGRSHDPRAASLAPCGFEAWERLSRAEGAQRIIEIVRRDKFWAKDSRLDQWVESIYCATIGMGSPGGAAASVPLGPSDVIADGSIVGYLQGELGITQATGVSAWASQIGGSILDMAQATGGNQPSYSANNAGIWGRATVTGDGSNDVMSSTWDPAAPGTTPISIRFVANRVSRIATSATLVGGNVGGVLQIRESSTSGSVVAFNGTGSSNVTMTAGAWYRGLAVYNASTSNDRLVIGSGTTGTGTSFGNNNSSALRIFGASATPSNPGNFAIQKLLVRTAVPTALELALLDGIDMAFYNGNITL